MQNEFYEVVLNYCAGDRYFFKDKDNAFAFLWQKFLNIAGDNSDEYIQRAFEDMNYFYMITGFGCVNVCGFED